MIGGKYNLWIGTVAILVSSSVAKSSFKFTNIKCEDHDVSFSSFEICKLSVIGRGVVSLDIRVGLYKTPVTNSRVNVAIYKRANGYKPFLYNVTHDLCVYFKNPDRYPVLKVIFSIFKSHTNFNHTCPYYDAIVVKDLVLVEEQFQMFPIPEGDYMFKMNVFAYNDLKASVQVSFTRTDSIFG